ncbi:hypothetical protein BKA67DRAFT_569923 [Truncatella angustata]|uniref:Uncharacterized protein n=1 Tax=Truncatella angustata TaxID=152316 RepID=A0A9P8ZX10_9PEZI|nr:uncharacterized protein BKA67DRAFT_569923 [Truncatella angustata]KAH6653492.1 hypothetical protein BKA67DRAFT_569923 [Truncatella angustata]
MEWSSPHRRSRRLAIRNASRAAVGKTQPYTAAQVNRPANFQGPPAYRQPRRRRRDKRAQSPITARLTTKTEPGDRPEDRAVNRTDNLVSPQDNTQQAADRHSNMSSIRPTVPMLNGNVSKNVPVPSLHSSSVSTSRPSAALSHSRVPSMASWTRHGPIINSRISELRRQALARAQASPTTSLRQSSLRPVTRPSLPSATPRPISAIPQTSPTAPPTIPTIQRRFEPSSTPVSLETPHGRVRIHYPMIMTDQIFRNTRIWMDVYPDCGYNFQVEAFVDRAGHAPAYIDCGTFLTLEQANRTVLQTFSEDIRGLMVDRYTSMVFRETDEVPSSPYWTGFCLGLHHPILRIWAKQVDSWSFRVETKMVANLVAP